MDRRHTQTHVEKQCEGAASGAGQQIPEYDGEVEGPDFNIEDIDPSQLARDVEEQIRQATEEDSDWDQEVQLDRMLNEVESQMKFECGSCGAKFKKKSQLTRHTREEHGEKCNFVCEVCGKVFNHRRNLDHHIREIHSERCEHLCEVCLKVFVSKRRLKRHIDEAHSERREHVCEVCRKSYASKRHLKSHIRRAHGEGYDFVCKVCRKDFKSNRDLRRHIKDVHDDECKVICPKCQKHYANNSYLLRHIRETHGEESKFVYADRQNDFPTGKNLHELTEARPSKRRRLDDEGDEEAVCLRESSQPSQPTSPVASTLALPSSELQTGLQRQIISKMSYSCNICGSTYKRKSGLDTHIRDKHGNVSAFQCEDCGKGYTTETGLQTHERKVHLKRSGLGTEGEAVCQREPCQPSQPLTPQAPTSPLPSVETQPGLQHRIAIKITFDCKLCGIEYTRASFLHRHIRKKHSEMCEWICEECSEPYPTERGLRSHLNRAHARPHDRDVDEPSTSRASAGSPPSLPSTSKRVI